MHIIWRIVDEALTELSPNSKICTPNLVGRPFLPRDYFAASEAWASMKSFRSKDGSGEPPAPGRNGERDFHREKRSNEAHSTTDPDARL
jgi:hypothetical protein